MVAARTFVSGTKLGSEEYLIEVDTGEILASFSQGGFAFNDFEII